MNGSSETAAGSERPCGLSSLLPIGMSCRGRAEAFARRLQSRLRTLGTQGSAQNDVETEHSENSWLTQTEQQVTNLQPLRHLSQEADSFFDFDIEHSPGSPGSPADECEYIRLIETASTTPHDGAPESGYVCASPISPEDSMESQSSSDGPYFDPENSDAEQKSITGDYYDCVDPKKENINLSTKIESIMPNGHLITILDSDSCSESLPPSQSDTTCTAPSSASNSTLQDEPEFVIQQQQQYEKLEQELEQQQQYEKLEQELENQQQNHSPSNKIQKTEIEINISPEHKLITADNKLLSSEVNKKIIQNEDDEIKTEEIMVNGYDTESINIVSNGVIENIENVQKNMNDLDNNTNSTIVENGGVEISRLEIEKQYILECLNAIETTPEISLPESKIEDDDKQKTKEFDFEIKIENNLDVPNYEGHLSASTDEDDVENSRPQRVRRCSSLKTGKTPPGTPGRKKIVRFADVLGLDLADVRTFMDEIPKIPSSAYDDLIVHDPIETPVSITLGPRAEKVLLPLFQQPGGLPNFLEAVRDKQVSLENAAVVDPICLTISGCARVRNLDFHKSVHIRYSLDGWLSFADLKANYVLNSCDGFSDKFSFTMFGNALKVGQRLELAVRFQCKGQQFWDNNYGQNYVFQCLPATTTPIRPLRPATQHDEWCQSFY